MGKTKLRPSNIPVTNINKYGRNSRKNQVAEQFIYPRMAKSKLILLLAIVACLLSLCAQTTAQSPLYLGSRIAAKRIMASRQDEDPSTTTEQRNAQEHAMARQDDSDVSLSQRDLQKDEKAKRQDAMPPRLMDLSLNKKRAKGIAPKHQDITPQEIEETIREVFNSQGKNLKDLSLNKKRAKRIAPKHQDVTPQEIEETIREVFNSQGKNLKDLSLNKKRAKRIAPKHQ